MTRMYNQSGAADGRLDTLDGRQRLARDLSVNALDALAKQAMAQVKREFREAAISCTIEGADPMPHIIAMAHALADPESDLFDTLVQDLRETGITVDVLCDSYLAPAARQLGVWWAEDRMTFAEVTVATTRVQALLRGLPKGRAIPGQDDSKAAIFAAAPGETHTLGVVMAAHHFRRLGWDIGLHLGLDGMDLAGVISEDSRDLVALSCGGRHGAEALRRLIVDLRMRRPELAIVLCGEIVQDADALADLPELDGTVTCLGDAEHALRAARQIRINATGHAV